MNHLSLKNPKLLKTFTPQNVELVEAGCCNLAAQIGNARKFGVPVVVAVNRFATDTEAELEAVRSKALEAGAFKALVCSHWAAGGTGAEELAKAVIEASDRSSEFRFLYPLELSLEEKMEKVAKEIYGADGIDILPEARKKLDLYSSQVGSFFSFLCLSCNELRFLILGSFLSYCYLTKMSIFVFSNPQLFSYRDFQPSLSAWPKHICRCPMTPR